MSNFKLTMLKPRVTSIAPRFTYTTARAERITGPQLQRLRRRFFRNNPCCVACAAKGIVRAATELDHIVPLIEGGTNNDDNLQLLCSECHKEKSAAENKARYGYA